MSPCSQALQLFHNADGISALPECVMSNILSRLPTKSALATSVLSRNWRPKWKYIYDIDITDECYTDEKGDSSWSLEEGLCEAKYARFCGYVDKVLNRDVSLRNVGIFLGTRLCGDGVRTLGFPLHDSHRVGRWISRILALHVKKLTIVGCNIECEGGIDQPIILERCNSLTDLKLKFGCNLEFRNQNCFPQLESLYLGGGHSGIRLVSTQSPNSGGIILSFPILKNLELENFGFMNATLVEINVPELISFNSYRYSRHSCDVMIKINAPKLARYVSDLSSVYEFVQRIPSLCYLELREVYISHMGEIYASQVESHITALLRRSVKLEFVLLQGAIIQDFLKWKLVHFLPTFNQLKRVALSNGITTKHLWEFLQATPNLEYLSLSVYDFETHENPLPPCVVSRLKIVNLKSFNGYSREIRLAKLFLEKAKNLQSLILSRGNPGRSWDFSISYWLRALGPENSNRVKIMDSEVNLSCVTPKTQEKYCSCQVGEQVIKFSEL